MKLRKKSPNGHEFLYLAPDRIPIASQAGDPEKLWVGDNLLTPDEVKELALRLAQWSTSRTLRIYSDGAVSA